MRFLLPILLAALLSGSAFAAPGDDPAAAARTLMSASTQLVDGVPGGDIWSPEMMALWAKVPEGKRSEFVSDPSLALPEFTVTDQDDSSAELNGTFTDAKGDEQDMVMELQLIDGNWKIKDMSSADGSYRLSSVLSAAAGTQ